MPNLRFDSREILWQQIHLIFSFFFIVTIKILEKDMSLNNT